MNGKNATAPNEEVQRALMVMSQVLERQNNHMNKRDIKQKLKESRKPTGSISDQIFKP